MAYQDLRSVGFEKLGDTGFFLKGKFLVGFNHDGRIIVALPELSFFDDYSSIVAIQYKSSYSDRQVLYVGYPTSRGTLTGASANSSGGNFEGDTSLLSLPLTAQLVKAGFQEVGFGLFMRPDEDGRGKPYDVYVVLQNNKVAMIASTQSKLSALISAQTVVIAHNVGRVSTEDSLTLDNGLMEFRIDTRGYPVKGSQKVHRELGAEEIGVEVPEYQIHGDVSQLGEINGSSIEELERIMRPGRFSYAGFLGDDEQLLEVLQRDDDYVTSLGLKHRDMAYPLLYAIYFNSRGYGEQFILGGVLYRADFVGWMGSQQSPFRDGTGASRDMTITNTVTGESLACSLLVPEMIARYGFYEGQGTDYRLDPRDIVKVFGLKSDT